MVLGRERQMDDVNSRPMSFFVRFSLSAALLVSLANANEPQIRIELNLEHPAKSQGRLDLENGDAHSFPVGFGRDGILKEGSKFRGGRSLLGTFRINAILSAERFEMTPELIANSGKSADFLREKLFANMSSIDFDGDGAGGEYGAAFLSLEPVSETKQPFAFNVYKGKFRWYSYAIHGTQNPARIGKKITGGCINVGAEDLVKLVEAAKLGDLVEVRLAR